jgi:hypothetical protein
MFLTRFRLVREPLRESASIRAFDSLGPWMSRIWCHRSNYQSVISLNERPPLSIKDLFRRFEIEILNNLRDDRALKVFLQEVLPESPEDVAKHIPNDYLKTVQSRLEKKLVPKLFGTISPEDRHLFEQGLPHIEQALRLQIDGVNDQA